MADDLPELNEKTHLGDGLYASFDGYCVILTAPRLEGNHWVELEPNVWRTLRRWLDQYPRLKDYMEGR